MTDLNGARVAVLATDGYEDSELTSPWQALVDAGARPAMVAPTPGEVKGKHSHVQPVDVTSADASSDDFDALVLPGGVVNADAIRMDMDSVNFARRFFGDHKPVGVICHGAWILIEADVVDGRTMTSFPSLQTDLRNAGAHWVNEEVVVDQGLVSSRTPNDLPAFNAKVVEEVAEGRHIGQTM